MSFTQPGQGGQFSPHLSRAPVCAHPTHGSCVYHVCKSLRFKLYNTTSGPMHDPAANKILFLIDSLPSPGLQLNLSSNNPFRNRAVSPASNGQLSPLEAPPRPVSRNPFLDASVQSQQPDSFASRAQRSPDKMSFAPTAVAQPSTALSGNAADLFVRHSFQALNFDPLVALGT